MLCALFRHKNIMYHKPYVWHCINTMHCRNFKSVSDLGLTLKQLICCCHKKNGFVVSKSFLIIWEGKLYFSAVHFQPQRKRYSCRNYGVKCYVLFFFLFFMAFFCLSYVSIWICDSFDYLCVSWTFAYS